MWQKYTSDAIPWDLGLQQSQLIHIPSIVGEICFKKKEGDIFHTDEHQWRNGSKGFRWYRSFFSGWSKQNSVHLETCWEHHSLIHALSHLCIYFSLNGHWFCRACWSSSNLHTFSTSKLVQVLAVCHQRSLYRRKKIVGPWAFCLIKRCLKCPGLHSGCLMCAHWKFRPWWLWSFSLLFR